MATTPIYGFTLPTVAGDSGVWGGFLNTDITALENELARLRIPFLTPTYNVGGTTTLDCSQTTGTRVHLLTVSGASTLAFSGVPSSSFDCKLSLIIVNGSAFVLTFPASVTWLSGIAPTFKASGTDIVDLETKDGGTTWFATLRNQRPGVIYQNQSLTTTSGSEVSLATYPLPAGTLAVNGQSLRVTVMGIAPAGGCSYNVKFGATSLTNGPINVGANRAFKAVMELVRTGAATQVSVLLATDGLPQVASQVRVTPAETLANAITIDFRGNSTTGGQTTTVDMVKVELLAVA